MTDIILHHYESSPFAEKVRALLGYKQLRWRSVEIPLVNSRHFVSARGKLAQGAARVEWRAYLCSSRALPRRDP